jgi:DNA recombination protein Rad52
MGDNDGKRFGEATVIALTQQLARDRVRQRQGRGGGQFSYLETHDVKRTANAIFGFDGWGYRIVELVELAAVEVESRNRQGWHVGYRCTVEVHVSGAPPTQGVGFGDGVEYGPGARVTACELAVKEAESDGLKRAFVRFGDQFGLSLYGKDDADRRNTRDQNADQATGAPVSIGEVLAQLSLYVEDGSPWIQEVVSAYFKVDGTKGMKALDTRQQLDLLKRLQQTIVSLDALDVETTNTEAMQLAVRTVPGSGPVLMLDGPLLDALGVAVITTVCEEAEPEHVMLIINDGHGSHVYTAGLENGEHVFAALCVHLKHLADRQGIKLSILTGGPGGQG